MLLSDQTQRGFLTQGYPNVAFRPNTKRVLTLWDTCKSYHKIINFHLHYSRWCAQLCECYCLLQQLLLDGCYLQHYMRMTGAQFNDLLTWTSARSSWPDTNYRLSCGAPVNLSPVNSSFFIGVTVLYCNQQVNVA